MLSLYVSAYMDSTVQTLGIGDNMGGCLQRHFQRVANSAEKEYKNALYYK